MKIGIVTIYNSQNCGSFLQAYALTNYINSLGHDTALVRNNMYYKNKFLYRSTMALKYLLKLDFKKAKTIFDTYRGFVKARKKYSYFDKSEAFDLCIFGSDTIWNIDGEYFDEEYKHYFGVDFNCNKITYAASVGPTDIDNILSNEEMCKGLKEFDAVSVRDDKTFELIKKVTGKEAEYVVDPTMLMPKSFYEDVAEFCPDEKYILFYCFEAIENDMLDEIKKFAKEKGLKLICFGDRITGCQKQLIFNPILMMTYYKNASFVVTDTFHGNVFSLIFNKPFINIERGKEKVTSLLKKFDLFQRTAKEAGDVADIVQSEIDFDIFNEKLNQNSQSSKKYLDNEITKSERRKNNAC